MKDITVNAVVNYFSKFELCIVQGVVIRVDPYNKDLILVQPLFVDNTKKDNREWIGKENCKEIEA